VREIAIRPRLLPEPERGRNRVDVELESACAMPHQRPQLPAFLDGLACLHLSNDVVDQRHDCTLISIQRAAGGRGPP
jgi:hypothetical protein